MQAQFSLQSELYPKLTPAGAYFAVSGNAENPSRTFLCNVLGERKPINATAEKVQAWGQTDNLESAVNILYRLQKLEFITGTLEPELVSANNMEATLPDLLKQLSDTGRALLANDTGLYIAESGFHHESAEEISALAGEVIRLSEQHALLIRNNLNINQSAWGICDPSGQSHLAFYPLYFGEYKFVLVIAGTPQLQSDAFVKMVEILYQRYGF
ncbi:MULTISPECIES: hypothetical protein [Vitreoscilla]|uniref:Peptidase M23 n=1 Tax=Vitreoscilla stercoraria TaxID=61 RepID=A0ABY4EBA0_VITST|nr:MULTISPECIES: hypothetical protein [Vitreoscilla]AUZ05895.2 hypothetical protein ADP71_25930 [Vitreoscilla sp. C1]UOO92732.1 peptidase M23 [Vitreoscilla stercoraria]